MQRIGKKGQAHFRLVVTEHTTRPKGEYLELLGSYDPHKNTMEVKTDRIKHWLSKGAKLSPTANNLLVGKKFIEGEKVQVWKAKKKIATEASPSKGSGSSVSTPATAPEAKLETETPVPTSEIETSTESVGVEETPPEPVAEASAPTA